MLFKYKNFFFPGEFFQPFFTQKWGHPAQKIYSIEFVNNVFKERYYKAYCLTSNESDSWKCALDYCKNWGNIFFLEKSTFI